MATTDFFALPNATNLVDGLMATTDKQKLDGIAAAATANATDAVLLARTNHTGTQPTSTITNFNTEVSSLANAAIGTHVASPDPHAQYELDIGNPSVNGYLLASTTVGVRSWVIPPAGLSTEEVQDIVAAMLVAGSNVTLAYNDALNKLTVSAIAGTGGTSGSVPATVLGDLLRGGLGGSIQSNAITDWAVPGLAITTSGFTGTNNANTLDGDDATFMTSTAILGVGFRYQLDLGAQRKVGSFRLLQRLPNMAATIVLSSSTDSVSWTQRIEINAYTPDTGRRLLVAEVTARYWRFEVIDVYLPADNHAWDISEVSLYTVPTVAATNVALPTSGAVADSISGTNAANIIDSDDRTYGTTATSLAINHWFSVDLGAVRSVVAYRLAQSAEAGFHSTAYTLQSSVDNTNWTSVYVYPGSRNPIDSGVIHFGGVISARYWRVLSTIAAVSAWTVATFEIYQELGITSGALERYGIGTIGQVLTVTDVVGANMPTWAALPPPAQIGRIKTATVTPYHWPGIGFSSFANAICQLSNMYYHPLKIDEAIEIDRFAIYVAIAVSGLIRGGVYTATKDYQPIALVKDLGDFNTSVTGFVFSTPSPTLILQPGLYTVACVGNNTITLRSWRGQNPFAGIDPTSGNFINRLIGAASYANPMPSTPVIAGSATNSTTPWEQFMLLRQVT